MSRRRSTQCLRVLLVLAILLSITIKLQSSRGVQNQMSTEEEKIPTKIEYDLTLSPEKSKSPTIKSPTCRYLSSPTNEAAPSPVDVRSSSCRCDPSTRNCSSTISWNQPITQGIQDLERYQIKFFKDRERVSDSLMCKNLSNNTRSFNFTFSADNVERNVIYFVLVSEPISLPMRSLPFYAVECQTKIIFEDELPHNVELWEGDDYTFTCKYTRYSSPLPRDVRWTHNQMDIHDNDSSYAVKTGPKVGKKSLYTNLTIKGLSKKHEGSYICYIKEVFDNSTAHSKGSILKVRMKPTSEPFKGLVYIIAGSAFCTVLVVALGAHRVVIYRSKSLWRPHRYTTAKRTHYVYISHYTQDMQTKKKVLNFAYNLENLYPNISVVLDLTRRLEIDEEGGLAQWVPQHMTDASKILVILSKEYMEACNVADNSCTNDGLNDDYQVLKVRAEYCYIQNHLHQNFHVSDRLIMAWQGEGKEEKELLPAFQGRSVYGLPQSKKGFEGNAIVNLLTKQDECQADSCGYLSEEI